MSTKTFLKGYAERLGFVTGFRDPEYLRIAKGRLDKAVEREVVNQEQQDDFELMGC